MGGLSALAKGFKEGYDAVGGIGDDIADSQYRAAKYKEYKDEAPLREKEREYKSKKMDYDAANMDRSQDTMNAIQELSAFQSVDPKDLNGPVNAPSLLSMYNKYWGPSHGFQASGARGDGTGQIIIDGTDSTGQPVSRAFSGDTLIRKLALSLDPKYIAEMEVSGSKNDASLEKSKELAVFQNNLAESRAVAAEGRSNAAPTSQQKNIEALQRAGYTPEQATLMVYGTRATIDPISGRTGAQTAAATDKAETAQQKAKDDTIKAAEAMLADDYAYATSTPEEQQAKYAAALKTAATRRGTSQLFPELNTASLSDQAPVAQTTQTPVATTSTPQLAQEAKAFYQSLLKQGVDKATARAQTEAKYAQ